LKERLGRARSILEPFSVLEFSDDPRDHLQCAKTFVAARFSQSVLRQRPIRSSSDRRVRLAYLSSDFRGHPVAHAIVNLLERRDRSRFEVIGASYGRDDGSDIWRRIVNGVDRFIDLSSESASECARVL